MPAIYDAGPARDAAAVTPSDSADLPGGVCNALYVGTAGNLSVVTVGGSTVLLTAVSGIMPLRCSRVRATGTTAAAIVALY